LQNFATAVKQLAHRAYTVLPKDNIRKQAGKAFMDGVEGPAIKIQLLLGGEKTVNEALRQALELQVVLLAYRAQKTSARTLCGKLKASNRAKRPMTIGMLQLWKSGHLWGNCPSRLEAENNDQHGK
jgi:hypothetical protein